MLLRKEIGLVQGQEGLHVKGGERERHVVAGDGILRDKLNVILNVL